MTLKACFVLGLLALLAGCTRRNPGFEPGGADGPPAGDVAVTLDLGRHDQQVPRDLGRPDQPGQSGKPKGVDVLLVVDNSAGMTYAHQWLARDLDELLGGLAALPGGPNLRVGVTTTDMGVGQFQNAGCSADGDAGELLVPGSCPQPQGGVGYLQQVGSNDNVPGASVDEAVGCYIKAVGTSGCGFEQPLKAMKAALGPTNKGFLRGDAALAVVILTNEDDCSAASNTLFDPYDSTLGPYTSYRCFQYGVLCGGQKPPLAPTLLASCEPGQQWLLDVQGQFVNYLKGLKPPGWVSVLVIGGPPAPQVTVIQTNYNPERYSVKETCFYSTVAGYPGFRLHQLADRMGAHGGFSSVCANNYRPALKGLLTRIQSAF